MDNNAIKSLIKNSGFSLIQIAKATGMGKSTISRIISGNYNIKDIHITMIKDGLVKLKNNKHKLSTTDGIAVEDAVIVTLVSDFKSLPPEMQDKMIEYLGIFKSLTKRTSEIVK